MELIRKSTVKAFIFDLDGTLIDSVDAHVRSWIHALKHIGVNNVDESSIRKLVGLSGKDILLRLYGENILKNYHRIRWIKDRAFLNELKAGGISLYPGVIKLLKYLKYSKCLIAIASSTPNYMLLHIADYLGLTNYVDLLVGGDEVLKGKPDPEIFIHTLKLLRVKASEAVVVGDTVYDIEPANKLMSTSILVNNPKLPTSPKPTYYFRWIFELLHFLISNKVKCST